MEYENKFVGLNPIDSDSTNNYSITTTPSVMLGIINNGYGNEIMTIKLS